jgi:hypothetical protein
MTTIGFILLYSNKAFILNNAASAKFNPTEIRI